MSLDGINSFYKGPIISCEYIDNDLLLIGYGPYLSILDDNTFEELDKIISLKYRCIHKTVINQSNSKLFCVFGQKAFNIVRLTDNHKLENLLNDSIELNDWILDIFFNDSYLIIVLAHNQCILFNLNNYRIEKEAYCQQKCML